MDKDLVGIVGEKYGIVGEVLDERGRRLWAAAEAKYLPHGGVSIVAEATGMSRTTIHAGMKELEAEERGGIPPGRSRKSGGGRKPVTHHSPDILEALDRLVEPTTRGDPESPLRWTCKSTRRLAA